MKSRNGLSFISPGKTGAWTSIWTAENYCACGTPEIRETLCANKRLWNLCYGTIFAVQNGVKGSRISVLEGKVNVNQNGKDKVLKPGDQLTTSPNVSNVPIETDVEWSRQFDVYMNLIKETNAVQKELADHPAKKRNRQYSPICQYCRMEQCFMYPSQIDNYFYDFNKLLEDRITSNPILKNWWMIK